MKKIFVLLIFCFAMIISLESQSVSNYTVRLDNGISVKMEQCWNHVWITPSYEALKAGDIPVGLSIRTLGDLTSGSSFKLFSSGKEVKVQGAKPGNYTVKVMFKLSGKPGTISFDVDNVIIKPQSKTVLSIVLYDYQISIDEIAGSQGGLAAFSSKVDKYKGNTEQNATCGVPAFYSPGKHDTPLAPGELKGKSGKIKPGTYDILITMGVQPRIQKVWLENFVMKPDVSYSITTNLNAGIVEYAGISKDFKAIHLYPAGSADKQRGSAIPDRNLEIMRCEGSGASATCPPGTYDVLMALGNRFEWRKGIVVKTGGRAQVK